MSKQKLYLAGGFESNWQEKIIAKLNTRFEIYNPREKNERNSIEYTVWDTHFIKYCDIIFAYMERSNPSGFGIAFEIGIASSLGKTIILVDEKSPIDVEFNKYFQLIQNSASIVFNTIDSGVEYLKTFDIFGNDII